MRWAEGREEKVIFFFKYESSDLNILKNFRLHCSISVYTVPFPITLFPFEWVKNITRAIDERNITKTR